MAHKNKKREKKRKTKNKFIYWWFLPYLTLTPKKQLLNRSTLIGFW